MRPKEKSQIASAPADEFDAAARFLALGWKRDIPWVVVEQVWPSARKFDRLLRETPGGWGFSFVTFRVLHAPMFDVYASELVSAGIIDAIQAYPTQRIAQFEELERLAYEAHGYPTALVAQLSTRQREPLNGDRFCSPILLVTSQPGSNQYTLRGAASSLDPILESLVVRGDIKIDQALELMILLTCHGKPGGAVLDSSSNDSAGADRWNRTSAFLQPFHPRRFKQVMSALRARTAGNSADERRAELYRLLSTRIRVVVESLRKNRPRSGKSLHSVARSRLVELVSDELGLSRKRAVRTAWWNELDDWMESERRSFFRSLTAAQRAAVQAARRGKMKKNGPSTQRVLLMRAKLKFDTALRERRRSPP